LRELLYILLYILYIVVKHVPCFFQVFRVLCIQSVCVVA
jgi:hypothetical protein